MTRVFLVDDHEIVRRGIELCRRIRSAHPEIPCLILTGYDDDAASIAAVVAGASGHVSSLAEKKQAGLATWACSDVTQIENRLDVRAENPGTIPDGLP